MTPTLPPLTQFSLTLAQGGNDPGIPGAAPAPTGTQQPPPVRPGPTRSPGTGNPWTFPLIILGMLVLFMVMTGRAGRKEKKRREEMLSALAKSDRVQTMGGIIGTVIEIQDNEVVLRVDEATNTRIRFARSAIQAVLRDARDKGRGTAGAVEAKPANSAVSV